MPVARRSEYAGRMAAPEYVPRPKAETARVYESPPWKFDPWMQVRPSDLDLGQPLGPRMGYPGPDQGFMLRLARRFESQLALAEGEDEQDVLAGATAIALRRASLFGRAPVIHDLTVALRIFGFLDDGHAPDPELVKFRRPLFEGCANPHHYSEVRALVDSIPEPVLRLTPQQIQERAARNWASLFEAEA
jgi:hypothetical protein